MSSFLAAPRTVKPLAMRARLMRSPSCLRVGVIAAPYATHCPLVDIECQRCCSFHDAFSGDGRLRPPLHLVVEPTVGRRQPLSQLQAEGAEGDADLQFVAGPAGSV